MSVEAYLNKGIKEIITEFPKVEEILNEFEIACSTCGEGLCLLKDVVEIHYMEEDVEAELMVRISNAIFPDKMIEFPKRKRKTSGPKEFNYSPPMKKMVDLFPSYEKDGRRTRSNKEMVSALTRSN